MARNLPVKSVGWGVAGLAVLILGLLAFYQMIPTPPTSPHKNAATVSVFRAKIPAIADSAPPEFVNRVTARAEEPTARPAPPPAVEKPSQAAERPAVAKAPAVQKRSQIAERPAVAERAPIAERPPAVEPQPAVKRPPDKSETPPDRIVQAKLKPPPDKPVAPEKASAPKSIYRESWLLDQDASFYTLQVLGVRNEASLLNFIKVHKLLQKQNVAYYKTVYKQKQWYPLLYGVYPTKSEAADAVKELPEKIQKSIPWIRRMAAIHKEVQAEAKR